MEGPAPKLGVRHQKKVEKRDLRHTHATWLIAQRVPMIAVAGRLGHANVVVTMMVYAHVDKLVDWGLLTADELGLPRVGS